MLRTVGAILTALLLAACASPKPAGDPSVGHLSTQDLPPSRGTIPQPVQRVIPLPRPKPVAKAETYSVVVNNVKVQDLLFALARDAKLNVDIYPDIGGYVSMNAIDQTLPQLLHRIARQVSMRFELDGPNLLVMPDDPFLRTYKIDYVNMSRDTTGSVAVTTQISTAGVSSTTGTSAAGGGNNSQTRIENKSLNHFWDTLTQNIKDILNETDKELLVGRRGCDESQVSNSVANAHGEFLAKAEASSNAKGAPASAGGNAANGASPQQSAQADSSSKGGTAAVTAEGNSQANKEANCKDYALQRAASVITNPEAGVITIRANSRQHERIQEFIDQVMNSAQRQVLIEATVAEVQLSDGYQQGIEWQALPFGAAGFRVIQKAAGSITAPVSSLLELGYTNSRGNISATVKLLESFGNVKVLSSPKISVLNNQTAVLKVVDNSVYFTIKADTTQNQTTTVTTYTTTLNQVPVGFVMNVTPQISDSDTVLLNIRPSISRIIGTVNDPNPALKIAGVTSEIPVIRSREMESVIRVENGNIAVMGGLMEDTLDNKDNAIPGISSIPVLGQLFTQRTDTARKTELVVFLRPIVIKNPSLDGDFNEYRSALPDQDFFNNIPDPQRRPENARREGTR